LVRTTSSKLGRNCSRPSAILLHTPKQTQTQTQTHTHIHTHTYTHTHTLNRQRHTHMADEKGGLESLIKRSRSHALLPFRRGKRHTTISPHHHLTDSLQLGLSHQRKQADSHPLSHSPDTHYAVILVVERRGSDSTMRPLLLLKEKENPAHTPSTPLSQPPQPSH
jgi:hypothetical protein